MDKRILVTGGNAGIGYAVCKQLATKGCHVFLCSRSTEKGLTAVKSILDEVPSAKVDLVQCDTSQVHGAASLGQRCLLTPIDFTPFLICALPPAPPRTSRCEQRLQL